MLSQTKPKEVLVYNSNIDYKNTVYYLVLLGYFDSFCYVI